MSVDSSVQVMSPVYRVLEIVRGQAGLLRRHWLHPSALLHPTSVSSPEHFSSGITLEVE